MRFLFLSGHAHLALDPSSQRASGGAELQVALLARALRERGHAVTIAAAETGQPDGITWEGIRVRTAGRFDTGRLGDTARALPRVARILREEKPDLAVIYGWTTWLYLLCLLRASRHFRVVFVCALDAEADGRFRRENPVRGRILERGLRKADRRLAITEHQARLFRQRGMPCAVTRLLLQQTEFAGGHAKSVDLLWVARCHPVKQPHRFLDLAAALPEARCRMICSVQDEELWRAVSSRAGTLPNVEFIETVPYRDIQGHFNAARIFVNTSEQEGVPNTFIHAGLGRAAILSLEVDPDEMFGQFRAGLCAGGDFELLRSEAERLLREPDALEAAQSEAVRFVREWHDNAANVEAFLNGIAK